jgi:hypothetical protein
MCVFSVKEILKICELIEVVPVIVGKKQLKTSSKLKVDPRRKSTKWADPSLADPSLANPSLADPSLAKLSYSRDARQVRPNPQQNLPEVWSRGGHTVSRSVRFEPKLDFCLCRVSANSLCLKSVLRLWRDLEGEQTTLTRPVLLFARYLPVKRTRMLEKFERKQFVLVISSRKPLK